LHVGKPCFLQFLQVVLTTLLTASKTNPEPDKPLALNASPSRATSLTLLDAALSVAPLPGLIDEAVALEGAVVEFLE
jgi:hypothetical protein